MPPGARVFDVETFRSDSLLAFLLQLWIEHRRTASRQQRNRAVRVECWLKVAIEQGAELTTNIPGLDPEVTERWLGRRLFWWSRGVPRGPFAGVAASRTGRDPVAVAEVLRALRLVLTSSWTNGVGSVVNVAGTSLSRYVTRAGVLFQLPILEVSVAESRTRPSRWLETLMRDVGEFSLLVSPAECETGETSGNLSALMQTIPARDRLLTLLADSLSVLHLRPNGHCYQAISARLEEQQRLPTSVRLVYGEQECLETVAAPLLQLGAVRWLLSSEELSETSSLKKGDLLTMTREPIPRERIKRIQLELACVHRDSTEEPEWLTHWTRAATHEWPDETPEQRLDVQLLDMEAADHSAAATLTRIVTERRIRLSSAGIQGGRLAVCLTAVPLMQQSERRVFRSHRGRWDFEPFGICIRTTRAKQLGIRPVIYGDESARSRIPEAEQLWFQLAGTKLAEDETGIDWRAEQEWRSPIDVPLDAFGPADLFVFCPTGELADRLQPLCNWPVMALSELQRSVELPTELIVVGASARAMAECAERSGFVVWSVDQFGDVDLDEVSAGMRVVSNWPAGIADAVCGLPDVPVLYGGALENSPDVIRRLKLERCLIGSSPGAVSAIRNPVRLQETLRNSGLPALEIAESIRSADCSQQWFLKPIASAAGINARRFEFPSSASELPDGCLLQQFVRGQTVSGLYLVGAGGVQLLGMTEQLCGVAEAGASGVLYAGSIAPLGEHELPGDCFREAEAIGNALLPSLRGLVGIDFIRDEAEKKLWTLEVNPRFPASAELFERLLEWPLIRWHVESCLGHDVKPRTSVPDRDRADIFTGVCGKLILYATSTVRIQSLQDVVTKLFGDDCEVADIPANGSLIEVGMPVCTLLLKRSTVESCREALLECGSALQDTLRQSCVSSDPP